VLAVGSTVLGAALVPTGVISRWLDPALGVVEAEEHPVMAPAVITVLTLVLVVAGAGLAYLRYVRDAVPVEQPRGSLVTQAARRDLYQDAVNEGVLMRPGIHLTRSLVFTDSRGIDGAAGGLAAMIGGASARVRKLQNGYVRSYALTMLAGVVVVLGALWVMQ
jgi:NADH-quinone oxidoreductase subunit L